MVNMLNNSLDTLINDLTNLEEGKRARELAIFLKNKYKTIDEIDNHKDDPMVSEFIDSLKELSNLSTLISKIFREELSI